MKAFVGVRQQPEVLHEFGTEMETVVEVELLTEAVRPNHVHSPLSSEYVLSTDEAISTVETNGRDVSAGWQAEEPTFPLLSL